MPKASKAKKYLGHHWGNNAVLRLPINQHHKIIVISDLHFPRSDSHPKYLYEFLLHNTCDTLILLGDTHEGYDESINEFGEMHLRVWDLITKRKAEGMCVIDIAGNHDTYKRQDSILGHRIFGTEYWNDFTVDDANGKTLLFHGDVIDGDLSKKYDKYVYRAAEKIKICNASLVDAFTAIEKIYGTMAGTITNKTNNSSMEISAAAIAKTMACQSVLNGHSHQPSEFSPVKSSPDISYGNTGAWVGKINTSMVMNDRGEWSLIRWNEKRGAFYNQKPDGIFANHEAMPYRDQTILEQSWHKAQHGVFTASALLDKTKRSLEQMEKVKKRFLTFLEAIEIKHRNSLDVVKTLTPEAEIQKINQSVPMAQGEPLVRQYA